MEDSDSADYYSWGGETEKDEEQQL